MERVPAAFFASIEEARRDAASKEGAVVNPTITYVVEASLVVYPELGR